MSDKRIKISRRFQCVTAVAVEGFEEITESLTKRSLFRVGAKNSKFQLTLTQSMSIASWLVLEGKDAKFVEKLDDGKNRQEWTLTDAANGFPAFEGLEDVEQAA